MMKIDAITNGIVIDHIKAGQGMRLYSLLKLDTVDAAVAVIRNATSRKLGKKDMIKIDAPITLDPNVIGYVDPEATVSIIRDGVAVEKRSIPLPDRLTNVIRCKNPRCISACEQELDQVFCLADPSERVYRCLYCETNA